MTEVDSFPFLGKRWKVSSSYTLDCPEMHAPIMCCVTPHFSKVN